MVEVARLDPGVALPGDHPRLRALRQLLARAAWRFPAALEEARLWARPTRPGVAPFADPARAFYRPGEVLDESGDGGPVDRPPGRLLPPH